MLKIACIPVFNEETAIYDVVSKTKLYVDKVVVCDDGSKDNTVTKAMEAGADIIRHERNLGKGAAMKTLFEYAKKLGADIVITMDGDGQFVPEEIPKLIKPILENKSDIVIGFRFDNASEMPSYRKFGNKVLDKITSMASNLPFRDTQSGFRAYSMKAIEQIQFTSNGFGADAEILVNASRKNLKISEERVTVIYNTGGKTSTKDPVSHFASVVTSLIETVALRHPLKYLGIPGFTLMIIGIAYSITALAIFNTTRYFSIPTTLIALGSLVVGLIMLLMSVVLFSISKSVSSH